ncbi:MAG TPA: D-alanyl-D-alanine carboxypeptidase family protein [Kofleriaceae bacterium]|nr:D-alanyl-D-alanine carboxypeptidase family protein [Kofleriaceae bacterium]
MRALLVLAFLCVLAGAAAADARPQLAKGYRHGKSLRLRIVEVDGAPVEVSTARAFRAMQRAAAADGIALRIVSGFRTFERQAELYRAWRQGYGNRAARPGHSNHQAGRALDLDLDGSVLAWLQANARRHGFHRTVRGEPWHWEFLGAPRRHARPAPPRRR